MAKLRMPVNEQDHKTGNPKAKVTLVEYGDYQCPHCGFAYPLIKQLLEEFNDKLLFVFRNFPLQEAHPAAMIAAQTAEAAALQHKFWEMHDMIYEHQEDLDEDGLLHFAETLSLNIDKLVHDCNTPAVVSKIESDFDSGVRSGVNGTPSFFINGNKLTGYDASYDSLSDAVRSLI